MRRRWPARLPVVAALAIAVAAHCPTTQAATTQPVTGKLRFTVVSLFGDQLLGTCDLRMRAERRRSGALALTRIEIVDGVGLYRMACGDLAACAGDGRRRTDASAPLPWRGRELGRADDRDVELRVCLDTCLGRFEGRVDGDLDATSAGGWRLALRSAPIGWSGMELSGHLRTTARAGTQRGNDHRRSV
jgi:hypothetical protein